VALAHLRYLDSADGAHRFLVRTGDNPYFVWITGREPRTAEGVTLMGDRERSSALLRSDPRGHAVIEVPADAFDRRDTSVQILSYRTEHLEGPAASALVRPLGSAGTGSDLRLPVRQSHAASPPRVRPQPADAPPISSAMFLEGVIGMIGQLLPAITHLFGSAAPAGPAAPAPAAPAAPSAPAVPPVSAGGAASGGPGGDIAALIARPETRRLLDALIRQVAGLSAGQSVPARRRRVGGHAYAEAKMFPAALLAALPALMPLLQNVLSPQTIQSVLQTADPNRLLSTITNGIGDLAKIGLQADQAQMDHLRALNPGLGDEFAERLLMSMSASAARQRYRQDYRRTDRVRLDFAGLEPATLFGGQPMIAFSPDAAWSFPLAVDTPQPIRGGTLVLLLQERLSMRTRFETAVEVDAGSSGALATVSIPPRVVQRLTAGDDYHVKATLTWPSRHGTLGTSRILLVTAARAATVGDVAGDGELVPLDDVTEHRVFWHRIWATDFGRELRRADLRVRYTYRLDADLRGTLREPTQSDATVPEGRWELTGTVTSGLRIGLDALNDLVSTLDGRPLDPAVLTACGDPTVAARLGGTAQTSVRLHGSPGEQAAIWVWPEVRMHRLTVHRPASVMPSGQVHSFTADEVRLPFPAMAHVLGASS
jgi:hypothetical protein